MEDLKQIIARNITELRKARGYTQIELAERLNYSDKAVSKWERGESVPDIGVLKEIADLFSVTVDYLLQPEHEAPERAARKISSRRTKNRGFITGMSVLLVWLIATFVFVVLSMVLREKSAAAWLSFVYAVPVSMIVWLVLNSLWFRARRNFLIISLLMWSLLAAIYVSFLAASRNLWLIFVLGIPGQAIILLWSRIRFKTGDKGEEKP